MTTTGKGTRHWNTGIGKGPTWHGHTFHPPKAHLVHPKVKRPKRPHHLRKHRTNQFRDARGRFAKRPKKP